MSKYTVDHTALLVAAIRARIGMPYSLEIAEMFGADRASDMLLGTDDQASRLVNTRGIIVEARYCHTNLLLQEKGISSIVEIGTGICPRVLEYAQRPDCEFLATGFKESIGWTRAMIKRFADDCDNVRTAVVDVTKVGSVAKAVRAHILQSGRRAFIVEGVIAWLPLEQKYAALKNIRSAMNPSDILITSDTACKADSTWPGSEVVLRRLAEKVGTSPQPFADRTEMLDCFEACGFHYRERSMLEVANSLNAPEVFGLDRDVAAEFLSTRHTAILRPRAQAA